MITVQEIFHLSIEIDMPKLAHRIFWALSEGKVKVDDDSEVLESLDYDDEAIEEILTRNVLDLGKIKLFVAETTEPNVFAFYYSENVVEAHTHHQALFGETPKRLTNAPHLLGKAFHLDETKDPEILYFHRSKVIAYPYYLGHARARGNVLCRVGQGANEPRFVC